MVSAVVQLPMFADGNDVEEEVCDTDNHSRRDILITRATAMFAERGFAATGIDDIAEAVGIAGPSIYSHFAGKQDILVAAIQRARDVLLSDTASILQQHIGAQHRLFELVRSYVGVAHRDRTVIRMLLSEMDQLPAAARKAARQDQRQYIETWVELLRESSEMDATTARIRVQAVLLMVNDVVQTPHLRARRGFEQTLARVAASLLGISTADQ